MGNFSSLKYDGIFILGILTIFVVLYRNLFELDVLARGNAFIPFPLSPGTLDALLSAWNFSSQGYRQTEVGYLLRWLSVMLTPFLGAANFQKILSLVPLPMSAICMFFFTGQLVGGRKWRYIISATYSLSPIMQVEFIAGSYDVLLAWAIFPVILLLVRSFLQYGSHKTLLILALLIAFIGGISVRPMLWYVLFSIALLAGMYFQREWRCGSSKVFFGLLMVLILVIVLLLPLVVATVINLIESQSFYLFRGYSPVDMPDHIFSFYLAFAKISDVIIYGLITGLLLIMRPIVRDRTRRGYYDASLIFAIPLTLFLMSIVVVGVVPNYYVSLFAFYTVEYPNFLFELLTFAYYIAIIAIIGEFQHRRKSQTMHPNLSKKGICIALILLISILPVFTTSYQQTHAHQFFEGMNFKSAEVPKTLPEALKFLEGQGQFDITGYRILWLPQIPGSSPYFYGAINTYIPRSLTASLLIGLGGDTLKLALSRLVSNSTANFGSLLAPLNVKYVIVDMTAQEYGGYFANGPTQPDGTGSPVEYIDLLNHQKDLRKIFESKDLVVYQNLAYLPQIVAYHSMYIVDTDKPITAETYRILGLDESTTLLLRKSDIPSYLLQQYLTISMGEVSLQGNITLPSFVSSVNEFIKVGPTEYVLRNIQPGPLYIVLGESYDIHWNALALRQEALHLPLPPYYTNLFYFHNVTVPVVTIVYSLQPLFTFSFVFSFLTWLIIIGLIVLSRLTPRFKQQFN